MTPFKSRNCGARVSQSRSACARVQTHQIIDAGRAAQLHRLVQQRIPLTQETKKFRHAHDREGSVQFVMGEARREAREGERRAPARVDDASALLDVRAWPCNAGLRVLCSD